MDNLDRIVVRLDCIINSLEALVGLLEDLEGRIDKLDNESAVRLANISSTITELFTR